MTRFARIGWLAARGSILGIALADVLFAAGARADAIGPCPAGQHAVTNPTPPGAMHHGGFRCESDCSVLAPGAARSPVGVVGSLAVLLGLGLAARRRR